MKSLIQTSFCQYSHYMWCVFSFDKCVTLGFLAVIFCNLNSALAAQPDASGQSSIATLFNSSRFSEALTACERAIKEHPLDANLRYWHASILVKLQRGAEARQEFEYVYTYSKNKTERDYALKACQLLDAPGAGAASVSGVTGQAPSGSAVVTQAPVSANSAADKILHQADVDSTHILIDGSRRQRAFSTQATIDANLAASMQSVDAMSRATVSVGNKSVPRYTPDEIQFARNQAIDYANQMRAQNDARGNRELQVAEQKAFETQASAANLAAQLNSGSRTGFHLKQEGTNLYVRQYNALPSGSSNSLNPAMVTIDDSANAIKGKFETPLQANARALDPALQKQLDIEAKKNVRSNVFGRLFPTDSNSDKH